jgi:hypothetical protein
MALLETQDQKETLDQVVSNWAWNSDVPQWCFCHEGMSVDMHRAPPRKNEEDCSEGGTGLFQAELPMEQFNGAAS